MTTRRGVKLVGGGEGVGIRSCGLGLGLGLGFSEARTDDVEAAYSKFECLGYLRGQRKTSMNSVFTPPLQ